GKENRKLAWYQFASNSRIVPDLLKKYIVLLLLNPSLTNERISVLTNISNKSNIPKILKYINFSKSDEVWFWITDRIGELSESFNHAKLYNSLFNSMNAFNDKINQFIALITPNHKCQITVNIDFLLRSLKVDITRILQSVPSLSTLWIPLVNWQKSGARTVNELNMKIRNDCLKYFKQIQAEDRENVMAFYQLYTYLKQQSLNECIGHHCMTIDDVLMCGFERKRLKKCKLIGSRNIDAFLQKQLKWRMASDGFEGNTRIIEMYKSSMTKSFELQRISDKIYCKRVTFDKIINGYVCLDYQSFEFIAEDIYYEDETATNATLEICSNYVSFAMRLNHFDIINFISGYYLANDSALEIYSRCGQSYLFVFNNIKDREEVKRKLENYKCKQFNTVSQIYKIKKKWIEGLISNFEYISEINKYSSRSLNNIYAYPVFPYIFGDSNKDTINLTDIFLYRNLSKPIAVQCQTNEQKAEATYVNLSTVVKNRYSLDIRPGPYHFPNVYSNYAIVSHYLIRVLPFTCHAIAHQGGEFDLSDRIYKSVSLSYNSILKQITTTDMKELTPEFFYLPEFLCNMQGFDFKKSQSGTAVDDVELPQWCRNQARCFIMIHRQALESDIVRTKLNSWIDLIFGYKQTDEMAVKALNTFNPWCYHGFQQKYDSDNFGVLTQNQFMKTIGSVPVKLFKNPHEQFHVYKHDKINLPDEQVFFPHWSIHNRVKGLKWGIYVGSLSNSSKRIISKSFNEYGHVVKSFFVYKQNIQVLPANYLYFTDTFCDPDDDIQSALIFGYDRIRTALVIADINSILQSRVLLAVGIGNVTVINTFQRILLLGNSDGIIWVMKCSLTTHKPNCNQVQLSHRIALIGHCHRITCIKISIDNHLIVSGCDGGKVCTWNLHNYEQLQSIEIDEAIINIAVCDPTGDIAVLTEPIWLKFNGHTNSLHLYNINLQHVRTWPYIFEDEYAFELKRHNEFMDVLGTLNAICTTNLPEGINVNVVVGGFSCGTIIYWSLYDLSIIQRFSFNSMLTEICAMSFTPSHKELYVACSNRKVFIITYEEDK
ncbi:hypothetical protein GJ496_005588, partial [Pomphorhynchus laevis]